MPPKVLREKKRKIIQSPLGRDNYHSCVDVCFPNLCFYANRDTHKHTEMGKGRMGRKRERERVKRDLYIERVPCNTFCFLTCFPHFKTTWQTLSRLLNIPLRYHILLDTQNLIVWIRHYVINTLLVGVQISLIQSYEPMFINISYINY